MMSIRFGEPIRRDVKYKLRPGAYAILPLGRRLLLTHQADPDDEYQLPGGGIDAGESPIAALHREVFEETGWHIATPRKIGFYRRFCYMPDYDLWAEKICHIYLARPVARISAPTEAGHTALWMDKDAAEVLVSNEGDRAFIASL